jgi:hypothetical protein
MGERGGWSGTQDRLEQEETTRGTEEFLSRSLRMRHQSKHISPLVTHAGDMIERPIGVRFGRGFPRRRDVPKDYLILALQARHGLAIGIIPPFIVVDGDAQHLPFGAPRRKWGLCGFHPNVNLPTDKIQARVSEEDARQ